MKRIKLLLLILTATLLILPANTVEASEQVDTTVLLPAGTKTTTVEMVLSDLQSLEGELRIKSLEGGECTPNDIKATGAEGAICKVSGSKIFMVGSGEPVTTTITVELQFSKDDTYILELVGGRTNKDGVYESGNNGLSIGKLSIYVGNNMIDGETPDDDQGSGDEEESDDSSEDTDPEENQYPTETTPQVETQHKEEVDYAALEKALNDVNQALNSNEGLKVLQDLINKTNEGTVLLDSEDQDKVDQAAQDIQDSLTRLEVSEDLKVEEEKSGKDDNSSLLKFILVILIVLFVVFNIVCLLLWRKAKKKVKDYNGAPMVDYNINEDDE